MSGYSRKEILVPGELIDLSKAIIYGNEPVEAVRKYRHYIDKITASEVIALVDELMTMDIFLDELKTGINKLLNLFHTSLEKEQTLELPEGSFLDILSKNNELSKQFGNAVSCLC